MLGRVDPPRKPNRSRRRRPRPQRRNISMRGAACLGLALCLLAVVGPASRTAAAEDGARCDDGAGGDPGSCDASGGGGDVRPPPNRMLRFDLNDDGSIALRDETYAPGVREDDDAWIRQLREMEGDARRTEELLASDEDDAARRRAVTVLAPDLFERLTSLAAAHREGWAAAASSAPSPEDGGEGGYEAGASGGADDDGGRLRAAREFDRAVNAYEAALDVYRRAWSVVAPEGEGGGGPSHHHPAAEERGGGGPSPAFSRYDQEGVLAGQVSIDLALADLYHQRFNVGATGGYDDDDDGGGPASGDCAAAYRHLLRAEERSKRSLELLESVDDGGVQGIQGERAMDHDVLVADVKQLMAFTNVRLGALLVDMYTAGYDLAEDMSSFVRPDVAEAYEGGPRRLGEGQRRMLELTLQKLQVGYAIYEQLSETNGAAIYRLNVADTRNYLGVVHGYLLLWPTAADDLEGSLSTYDRILEGYRAHGMVADALEIASSMIQTTQSLWEAYLNLPGKTEFAKEAFRRHLALRRYFNRQTPLDQPLADEEGGEDAFFHGVDEDLPLEYDLSQHEETLERYQTMLNDYLQMQSEYPPDGSYFDVTFDDLGANPSYIQHDKVYEGSLRSTIGSLQLSQNKLWEARGELELAVSLLSDGADDGYGDLFEAYDENGEIIEYPVKLELANALLNLSYAQLGLMQWRSSYESFEDAMDLYASELAEGEAPMNHSDPAMMEAKKGNSWSDILTSYMKGSAGTKEDATPLKEDPTEAKDVIREESRYITIDDYQMVENITDTSYDGYILS